LGNGSSAALVDRGTSCGSTGRVAHHERLHPQIEITCNVYEIILSLPIHFTQFGMVTKDDKELEVYRIARPELFSGGMKLVSGQIDKAIQSLKGEIT
jgi:hypothetical protein